MWKWWQIKNWCEIELLLFLSHDISEVWLVRGNAKEGGCKKVFFSWWPPLFFSFGGWMSVCDCGLFSPALVRGKIQTPPGASLSAFRPGGGKIPKKKMKEKKAQNENRRRIFLAVYYSFEKQSTRANQIFLLNKYLVKMIFSGLGFYCVIFCCCYCPVCVFSSLLVVGLAWPTPSRHLNVIFSFFHVDLVGSLW